MVHEEIYIYLFLTKLIVSPCWSLSLWDSEICPGVTEHGEIEKAHRKRLCIQRKEVFCLCVSLPVSGVCAQSSPTHTSCVNLSSYFFQQILLFMFQGTSFIRGTQ